MKEKENIETDAEKVEDNIEIEVKAEVITNDEQNAGDAGEESKETKVKKSSTHTLKDALKQVETIGQALQGRGNVVMVRVNDEALDHLNMLVEADITKSRSESAAFLINEGISANGALFDKISSITHKISALREQLRNEVKLNIEE